jgi:hypothetical protein
MMDQAQRGIIELIEAQRAALAIRQAAEKG